jgi:hypothetical protein
MQRCHPRRRTLTMMIGGSVYHQVASTSIPLMIHARNLIHACTLFGCQSS